MIYRVLFLNFKEIKVLPKTHWEHIHENDRNLFKSLRMPSENQKSRCFGASL